MQGIIVTLALYLAFMVSGCGGGRIYPVTDGFHKSLPKIDTRIVVWGNHPASSGTATTWLQKRGLIVLERARLQQIFDEQSVRLTHTPDDDGQILRVGKLLGAAIVVFIDGSSSQGVASQFSVGKYGGGGSSSTVSSAAVSVRGVDVETSEVLWSGNARVPEQTISSVEDALIKLTCQALATAWDFRPPGDLPIPSQAMCMADKKYQSN